MTTKKENILMFTVLFLFIFGLIGGLIGIIYQKQATPNPTHKIDITTITDSEGNSYIGFIYGNDLEVLPLTTQEER